MATAPVYMSAMCVARCHVSTVNTGRDGSGSFDSPAWGGTGGVQPPQTDWLLKRVVLYQTGDLADGILSIFSWDGSTARILAEIDTANPSASSTTTTGYTLEQPFQEWAFPATWDLRFALTVAPTSGYMAVHAFCERS